jgi:DNA polymerase-1
MIDFQSLVGDSADNIPGIKGIGPVMAAKLINEYKTLKEIYKNIDRIVPQKIKEKLLLYKDDAEISYKLATLDKNVAVAKSISDIKIDYDYDKATNFLNSFGFHNLIKRIPVSY